MTVHQPASQMSAHRHLAPYMAWVLGGSFDEKSINGRYRCRPGTLILHPAYHAHADTFGEDGAQVANAPLAEAFAPVMRVFHVPRSVKRAKMFYADAVAFVEEAMTCGEPIAPSPPPVWVSAVASGLVHSRRTLRNLAREAGVSAEHATRTIVKWFGLPPRALRSERRLLMALDALMRGERLATLAAAAGYADQSHMTRAVRRATGLTPAALAARGSQSFKITHTPRF